MCVGKPLVVQHKVCKSKRPHLRHPPHVFASRSNTLPTTKDRSAVNCNDDPCCTTMRKAAMMYALYAFRNAFPSHGASTCLHNSNAVRNTQAQHAHQWRCRVLLTNHIVPDARTQQPEHRPRISPEIKPLSCEGNVVTITILEDRHQNKAILTVPIWKNFKKTVPTNHNAKANDLKHTSAIAGTCASEGCLCNKSWCDKLCNWGGWNVNCATLWWKPGLVSLLLLRRKFIMALHSSV